MYRPMDDNGQYNIDCRLSREKDMEDNISTMIQFATEVRKDEVGEAKVRNKHEGYGFLADFYQTLIHCAKQVKDGMNDLLNALPGDDTTAVNKTESLSRALEDIILSGVRMAAEARRVSGDLYKEAWDPTPIEQYMNDEDDGFAEPKEDEDGED